MSRVAKKPIALPKGVECTISADKVSVKGPKGTLNLARPHGVDVAMEDGHVQFSTVLMPIVSRWPVLHVRCFANMITGVSVGYVRKLELVGVGYRAAMAGKDLNLSLGFSHPVLFKTPDGITIADANCRLKS